MVGTHAHLATGWTQNLWVRIAILPHSSCDTGKSFPALWLIPF